MRPRTRRPAVLLSTTLLGVTALAGPGAVTPAAGVPGDPGYDAGPLVLASGVDLHEYDALARDGKVHVAWISSPTGAANRRVWVCTIPAGGNACQGGAQSFDPGSGGASSASGLRVLASGPSVELVWFHDTPQSIDGPQNAQIVDMLLDATATSPVSVQTRSAPSFGRLLTAERGAGGLWTVAAPSSGSGLRIERPGAPPQTIPTPWLVNQARLAFSGSTPVLVYDRYGSITEPLRVTRFVDGAWQPATRVAGTWTVGGAFDLESARGRVHLVSSVNNASYRPQIAVWQGRGFGPRRPTGNTSSCQAATHDLVTDGSGRLADVARQCTRLAIANHPQRGTSAIVREGIGGTPSGDLAPQIATRADGLGRVVYSRSTTGGDVLLTTRIRLPALSRTVASRVTPGGRATVRGPVSCLPASRTRVAVGARPARGWRVVSRSLRRSGRAQGAVLDGRSLTPGASYRLVGTVVFAKGSQRATARATLVFNRCATS